MNICIYIMHICIYVSYAYMIYAYHTQPIASLSDKISPRTEYPDAIPGYNPAGLDTFYRCDIIAHSSAYPTAHPLTHPPVRPFSHPFA